ASSPLTCNFSSFFIFYCDMDIRDLHSFPTRRSSDLENLPSTFNISSSTSSIESDSPIRECIIGSSENCSTVGGVGIRDCVSNGRSEEHTSELQSRFDIVCRLLLEKKNMIVFKKTLIY